MSECKRASDEESELEKNRGKERARESERERERAREGERARAIGVLWRGKGANVWCIEL